MIAWGSSQLELNEIPDWVDSNSISESLTEIRSLVDLTDSNAVALSLEFDEPDAQRLAAALNTKSHLKILVLKGAHINDALIRLLRLSSLEAIILNKTNVNGTGFCDGSRFPKLHRVDITFSALTRDGMACLSYIPLSHLNLSNTKLEDGSLQLLSNFQHLRILDIGCSRCSSLVLAKLPNSLEDLNLSGCTFPQGLNGLEHLHKLRRLMLVGAAITPESADSINKLTTLHSLYLPEHGPIDPWLRGLAGLKQLREFPIYFFKFSDQTGTLLSNFSKLEKINVPLRVPYSFLQCLSNFHELQKLNLTGHKELSDSTIDWRSFPKLWDLHLADTSVGDKAISQLTGSPLISLSLRRTKISPASLQSLSHLRTLKHLILSGNPFVGQNLEVLAPLQQLRVLELARTRLSNSDLLHLPRLRKLIYLNLSNNMSLNQSNPICRLPSLGTVNLSNTMIDHNGIARLKHCLPKCYVQLMLPD